ncbi:MAG: hypothetical protein QXG16_02865 [Candidatus Anstonellaceae archaeon]
MNLLKTIVFVLLYFSGNFLYSSIYLTQANLVGQTIEILVDGGANSSILIIKPNGESFSKQLDEFGQTKIFLDQPGVWTFSYGPYSKTLVVRDKPIEKAEVENSFDLLAMVGFFIIVLSGILLAYLLYNSYKNINIKEPSLSKIVSEGQVGVIFQASRDILEDVQLKVEQKDNTIVITRKKLLPFEKVSYFCPPDLFSNASVSYKIGQETFSISLDKKEDLGSIPSQQIGEALNNKKNQIKKEKKKLRKLN